MTCIVGMTHGGKVYIGADSLGSETTSVKEKRREHKVFLVGDFLIGGCGSFRMLNLLQWKLELPEYSGLTNLHKYMCTHFVDAVRQVYLENGFAVANEYWTTEEFLVGIRGRLFKIHDDFHVAEYDYTTIGSGEYHALGSLYTSKRTNPHKSILKALKCAETFVGSVQSPFIIKSI